MTKEQMINAIQRSAQENSIDTLLFYMQEYREEFTPFEIARIYFKEVCEYSIELAHEVTEDMKDWS